MAYSDKVLDHYENPRNVGSLDKEDPNSTVLFIGCSERSKLPNNDALT